MNAGVGRTLLHAAMRKRILVRILLGVIALPVLSVALVLAYTFLRPYDLPAPTPRPPLASIAVHQVQWKDCKAVEAALQSGTYLCNVINCDVVDGFAPQMSLEAARARHGAPAGEWRDPHYDANAYYYEVPAGRVSLCLAPDSGQGHWVTVGYPKRSACKDVVLDPRLLAQIREIRGTDDEIYLTLRPADHVRGGISVFMKRDVCESFEFLGRESSDGSVR